MSKQLQKEIYKSVYELSEKFPEKPSLKPGLDEEIALIARTNTAVTAAGKGD